MFPGAEQVSERDRRDKRARIGVFICHCGHNIAGYLDIPALVESASALPQVVFVRDSMFTCSDAGLTEIRQAIAEHKLNRVVVASCTPRTHESLFQANCEEAGLNRYLFEFVNIRDQCSWVHMRQQKLATDKARDLIRMGVAKAALLQPLEQTELAVQPAAAVIGGGIAGLTAALSLAHRGFAVTLLERQPDLGGTLRSLYKLYPTNADAQALLERTIAEVKEHPQIDLFTSAEIQRIGGCIGNYELVVRSGQAGMDLPIQVGAIIVATGAEELKPQGLYGYGANPRVITQQELEQRLALDPTQSPVMSDRAPYPTVAMIQCVGARDSARAYCGRTCCMTAIKNAIQIKTREARTEVHILYRDIEVHGTHFEDYYAQARDLGVIFTRFTPADPPRVDGERVIVYDEHLGMHLGIPFDLLVLSTPLVPHQNVHELARMLKVPVDEYGFFLEAHVKLRPLDFATDGVYVCGSAHWPAHLDEAISQALGAAARAATVLSKQQIRSSGAVAHVDEYLCRGCRRCADICDFGAIDFAESKQAGILYSPPGQSISRTVARVNPVLCKGCGACAVVCPTCALQASHFTSNQVTAMVRAAMGG